MWLFFANVYAEAPSSDAKQESTPSVPSEKQSSADISVDDSLMEPSVVISGGKEAEIREYRVNGQVYMILIKPKYGPPYYLVDTTADGRLDSRHNLGPNVLVPSWVLLSLLMLCS